MFTMKKLALISAAGLAALSISCSDSDTDEVISGFNVTDSNAGIALSGEITAPEGATVTVIAVTAGGNPTTLVPQPTLGNKVILTGTYVTGVCGTQTGTIKVNFAIAASISDGSSATATKDGVSIDCDRTITPPLVKKSITLASAGNSYADLDNGQTYNQDAAASIKNKIDLVAYNGQVGDEGGTEDMIYAPTELDFFYTPDFTYLGGDVLFFKIPPAGAAILKTASTVADLLPFANLMDSIVDDEENEASRISIAVDTAFLVGTSEGDVYAVIITATGSKSVSLSSITMPDED